MFDKMIISDDNSVESKSRSRYFLVSTTVVGILFLTAVVFSLYAADIGLGNDEFELSTMLAPVTPTEPEPIRPEPERDRSQPQTSDRQTRVHNILRIDEVPISVPDKTSVNPGKFMTRPPGEFDFGPIDTASHSGAPGAGTKGGGGSSAAGSSIEPEPVAETAKIVEPPPVIKPKPPTTVSKGVINGRATSLPPPPYPAPAKMVGAYGAVNVQVTIDESGKVISAKAVDGHPLLRQAAEKAAWNAKFSPTKLSEIPVKVTGVIVYNFKRS